MTAQPEDGPLIEWAWEGRLEEWLAAILPDGPRRIRCGGKLLPAAQDQCFPTDALAAEYVESVGLRSEDEVKQLLRRFLFGPGSFIHDGSNAERVLQAGLDYQNTGVPGEEYCRRLVKWFRRKDFPHPGVQWVLDLLPDSPRQALAVIQAYTAAPHVLYMPDWPLNGLYDAMSVIRARYIGRPVEAEEKRGALFELSPRDFERLVARLYKSMGYETQVTPTVGDGGWDVLAKRIAVGRREKILIECKLRTDRIGVEHIRSLNGVVDNERATKGIMIAGSDFTRGARRFAEDSERLDLVSGIELVLLLNEYEGSNWPSRLDTLLADLPALART
jgi:restriction system protein